MLRRIKCGTVALNRGEEFGLKIKLKLDLMFSEMSEIGHFYLKTTTFCDYVNQQTGILCQPRLSVVSPSVGNRPFTPKTPTEANLERLYKVLEV